MELLVHDLSDHQIKFCNFFFWILVYTKAGLELLEYLSLLNSWCSIILLRRRGVVEDKVHIFLVFYWKLLVNTSPFAFVKGNCSLCSRLILLLFLFLLQSLFKIFTIKFIFGLFYCCQEVWVWIALLFLFFSTSCPSKALAISYN